MQKAITISQCLYHNDKSLLGQLLKISIKTMQNVLYTLFHLFKIKFVIPHTITLNPLSSNFTKWSNTLKQFVSKLPTNCLSVFDHFVGLALRGLIQTKKDIPIRHIGNKCSSAASIH